jgi:hypothetical protein
MAAWTGAFGADPKKRPTKTFGQPTGSAYGDAIASQPPPSPFPGVSPTPTKTPYDQARADNGAANAGAAAGWRGDEFTPEVAPPPPPAGPEKAPGQNGALLGAAGLFSGPGAGETYIKDHIGEFDDPWAVEGLYGSGASDALKTSRSGQRGDVGGGAYNDYVVQNKDAFAGPGQRETLYDDIGGDLAGTNYAAGAMRTIGTPTLDASRRVFEDAEGTLGKPGAVNERYDEMGDSFNDPGAVEGIYDQYGQDPLRTKSYSETLYDSGIERLNPYYDYAEKKAIDQAQRGTAARGGFNSGLAAAGERDITTNLRGQQAMAQERLAPIADAERRARYDQGFSFAGQRDQENRDRVNAAFDLAGRDQEAEEGRFKTRGTLATGADEAGAAQGRLTIDAARAESDAAAAADASAVNRARAAGDLAAGSDDSYRSRILDAGDMIYRGDELDLDRDRENRLRDTQADFEERSRLDALYGQAGAADAGRAGRIGTGVGMATEQQGLGEDRINTMIRGMAGQDENEAKLLTDIYNDMKDVNEIDEQWIQVTAEKYGIDLQQMRDIAGALGTLLGSGGDIAKAVAKA